MEDSIFTKIIRGDIPCHKVYEDEHTFAFMDINPVQKGMLLVVPKLQTDNIEELPADQFTQLMNTVQTCMKALRLAYPNRKKIGLQVEGLEVPHAHVKLIPFDTPEEFTARAPQKEPDHEDLAIQAALLRSKL